MLAQLTPAQRAALTGRRFFPGLISAPFRAGLHAALDFAIVASLLAAWASWQRGERYVYHRGDEADAEGDQLVPTVADLTAEEAIGADTEALP